MKSSIKLTAQELGDILRASHGKIVGVDFVKRSTGEVRSMSCRLGVVKYLNGGVWANGTAGRPADHGLVVVFDLGKSAYRSIPIEGIKSLTSNGIHYTTGE